MSLKSFRTVSEGPEWSGFPLEDQIDILSGAFTEEIGSAKDEASKVALYKDFAESRRVLAANKAKERLGDKAPLVTTAFMEFLDTEEQLSKESAGPTVGDGSKMPDFDPALVVRQVEAVEILTGKSLGGKELREEFTKNGARGLAPERVRGVLADPAFQSARDQAKQDHKDLDTFFSLTANEEPLEFKPWMKDAKNPDGLVQIRKKPVPGPAYEVKFPDGNIEEMRFGKEVGQLEPFNAGEKAVMGAGTVGTLFAQRLKDLFGDATAPAGQRTPEQQKSLERFQGPAFDTSTTEEEFGPLDLHTPSTGQLLKFIGTRANRLTDEQRKDFEEQRGSYDISSLRANALSAPIRGSVVQGIEGLAGTVDLARRTVGGSEDSMVADFSRGGREAASIIKRNLAPSKADAGVVSQSLATIIESGSGLVTDILFAKGAGRLAKIGGLTESAAAQASKAGFAASASNKVVGSTYNDAFSGYRERGLGLTEAHDRAAKEAEAVGLFTALIERAGAAEFFLSPKQAKSVADVVRKGFQGGVVEGLGEEAPQAFVETAMRELFREDGSANTEIANLRKALGRGNLEAFKESNLIQSTIGGFGAGAAVGTVQAAAGLPGKKEAPVPDTAALSNEELKKAANAALVQPEISGEEGSAGKSRREAIEAVPDVLIPEIPTKPTVVEKLATPTPPTNETETAPDPVAPVVQPAPRSPEPPAAREPGPAAREPDPEPEPAVADTPASRVRASMGTPREGFATQVEMPKGTRVELTDNDTGGVTATFETPKDKRKQGAATEAITKLVEVAKEQGVPVTLDVEPFGNERPMNREQLASLYAKNGFVMQDDGKTMIFDPKAEAPIKGQDPVTPTEVLPETPTPKADAIKTDEAKAETVKPLDIPEQAPEKEADVKGQEEVLTPAPTPAPTVKPKAKTTEQAKADPKKTPEYRKREKFSEVAEEEALNFDDTAMLKRRARKALEAGYIDEQDYQGVIRLHDSNVAEAKAEAKKTKEEPEYDMSDAWDELNTSLRMNLEAQAEAPKAEAPKAEAPKAEAPKAEAPKAEVISADQINERFSPKRLPADLTERFNRLKSQLGEEGIVWLANKLRRDMALSGNKNYFPILPDLEGNSDLAERYRANWEVKTTKAEAPKAEPAKPAKTKREPANKDLIKAQRIADTATKGRNDQAREAALNAVIDQIIEDPDTPIALLTTIAKRAAGTRGVLTAEREARAAGNVGTIDTGLQESRADTGRLQPDEAAIANEETAQVEEVLKGLSKIERAALRGAAEGKSNEQIAKEIGTTANTVANAKSRGRDKLRKALERDQEPAVPVHQNTAPPQPATPLTDQELLEQFVPLLARSTGRAEAEVRERMRVSGKPPTKAQESARKIGEFFGRRVVFVAGVRVNGMFHPGMPGTVFLSDNGSRSEVLVVFHELLHSLAATDPAAYKKLKDAVKVDLDAYVMKYQSRKNASLDVTNEEFLADFMADRATTPEFWEGVAAKDRPLFTKLVDLFRSILKSVSKGRFGTENFVANIAEADAALRDALNTLRLQGPAARTSPTEEQVQQIIEETLTDADKAVAAKEMGGRVWSNKTKTQFTKRMADWLVSKSDPSAKLVEMFRRVLNASKKFMLLTVAAISITSTTAPDVQAISPRQVVVETRTVFVPVPVPVLTPIQAPTPAPAPAPEPAPQPEPVATAAFGETPVSQNVQVMANWVVQNQDNGGDPFLIADKTEGSLYMFDPSGTLLNKAPALFGASVGDSFSGRQLNQSLSETRSNKKDQITPAGRFDTSVDNTAEYGKTIDFFRKKDSTIAIHKVFLGRETTERRRQRLATSTGEDNRISLGCVNLPEDSISDAVALMESGGPVYVLPETPEGKELFEGFGDLRFERRARQVQTAGTDNLFVTAKPTKTAAVEKALKRSFDHASAPVDAEGVKKATRFLAKLTNPKYVAQLQQAARRNGVAAEDVHVITGMARGAVVAYAARLAETDYKAAEQLIHKLYKLSSNIGFLFPDGVVNATSIGKALRSLRSYEGGSIVGLFNAEAEGRAEFVKQAQGEEVASQVKAVADAEIQSADAEDLADAITLELDPALKAKVVEAESKAREAWRKVAQLVVAFHKSKNLIKTELPEGMDADSLVDRFDKLANDDNASLDDIIAAFDELFPSLGPDFAAAEVKKARTSNKKATEAKEEATGTTTTTNQTDIMGKRRIGLVTRAKNEVSAEQEALKKDFDALMTSNKTEEEFVTAYKALGGTADVGADLYKANKTLIERQQNKRMDTEKRQAEAAAKRRADNAAEREQAAFDKAQEFVDKVGDKPIPRRPTTDNETPAKVVRRFINPGNAEITLETFEAQLAEFVNGEGEQYFTDDQIQEISARADLARKDAIEVRSDKAKARAESEIAKRVERAKVKRKAAFYKAQEFIDSINDVKEPKRPTAEADSPRKVVARYINPKNAGISDDAFAGQLREFTNSEGEQFFTDDQIEEIVIRAKTARFEAEAARSLRAQNKFEDQVARRDVANLRKANDLFAGRSAKDPSGRSVRDIILEDFINNPERTILTQDERIEFAAEVLREKTDLPEDQIDGVARMIEGQLALKLNEAKLAAARPLLRSLGGKNLTRSQIEKAIRLEILDPSNDFVTSIAALSGWEGLTPAETADLTRLQREIDLVGPLSRAGMTRIMQQARIIEAAPGIPPLTKDTVNAYIRGSIYSSIGSQLVGLTVGVWESHMLMAQEVAVSIGRNKGDIGRTLEELLELHKGWATNVGRGIREFGRAMRTGATYLEQVQGGQENLGKGEGKVFVDPLTRTYDDANKKLKKAIADYRSGKVKGAGQILWQAFRKWVVASGRFTFRMLGSVDASWTKMNAGTIANIIAFRRARDMGLTKANLEAVMAEAQRHAEAHRSYLVNDVGLTNRNEIAIEVQDALEGAFHQALSAQGVEGLETLLDEAASDFQDKIGTGDTSDKTLIGRATKSVTSVIQTFPFPLAGIIPAVRTVGNVMDGLMWTAPGVGLYRAIRFNGATTEDRNAYFPNIKADWQFRRRQAMAVLTNAATLGIVAMLKANEEEDDDKKWFWWTGAYPYLDQTEQDRWKRNEWTENTLMVGGLRFQLDRGFGQTLLVPMVVGSMAYEASDGVDGKEMVAGFTGLAEVLVPGFSQGRDRFKSMESVYGFKSFAENQVAMAVPFSALLKSFRRMQDRIDPQNTEATYFQHNPFYTTTTADGVSTLRNVLGEPMAQDSNPWGWLKKIGSPIHFTMDIPDRDPVKKQISDDFFAKKYAGGEVTLKEFKARLEESDVTFTPSLYRKWKETRIANFIDLYTVRREKLIEDQDYSNAVGGVWAKAGRRADRELGIER